MNVREVLEGLASLPDEAVIFAERVDGRFTLDSRAMVLELAEEELNRPILAVARERAPGLHYFLEVFVVRELIDGWKANLQVGTDTRDLLEAVIHYAEHDA